MRTLYFCPVVSSIFLLLFLPRLVSAVAHCMSTVLPHMVWPSCEFRMCVWNVLHVARWKYITQKWSKIRHLRTITQLCRALSSQLRRVSTIGKKLVKLQYLLHMSSQYGELRPTNVWDRFWDTPANFNAFRVLAALLRGTLVVGVSQILRHWTEGATYIRQGGHHVGHWPTFYTVSQKCARFK